MTYHIEANRRIKKAFKINQFALDFTYVFVLKNYGFYSLDRFRGNV